MNEHTTELIEKLAEKLGTTAEHLWGVLVKQAVISASYNIALAVALTGLWLWAFRFVRGKTTAPAPTEEDRFPDAEWRDEGVFAAWLLLAVGLVVIVVQASTAVGIGITALANPEYWALKQVMP